MHELVGHSASLLHPGIAELSRAFGHAAALEDDAGIEELVRVYWWTLEFGLVVHDGRVTALGAGLLSSAGELAGTDTGPAVQDWDLDAMAATPFDPTRPNPVLFLAPSLDRFIDDLTGWLQARPPTREAVGAASKPCGCRSLIDLPSEA